MPDLNTKIAADLKKHNLRLSAPRIAIYRCLLENRIHPDAEWIYRNLSAGNPNLSLTTVYNTLKSFAEAGLVKPLTIEERDVRYDINTRFHAHFKCRKCKSVTDCCTESTPETLPAPGPEFHIECIQLDYYGMCRECKEHSPE